NAPPRHTPRPRCRAVLREESRRGPAPGRMGLRGRLGPMATIGLGAITVRETLADGRAPPPRGGGWVGEAYFDAAALLDDLRRQAPRAPPLIINTPAPKGSG